MKTLGERTEVTDGTAQANTDPEPQGSARAVQLQAESKAVWSEPAESGWILLLSATLAYDIMKNNGFLT